MINLNDRISKLEQQAPDELDISALTREERAEFENIMFSNGATLNTEPDYENMSDNDLIRLNEILDKVKEKT